MTLKAKERRAILDQTLTARASVVPSERPALAPRQLGPIAEQANLQAEHVATRAKAYDEAKAQGRLLLPLDPKKIRATEFRNRHDLSLLADDPKFKELVASLRAHGQETPIRVRPIRNAAPFEFEIVSGHRRHAACLALDAETEGGFRILAIVDAKASETRDLVLKMYRENEERYDLSAFEKGRMFARWLAQGLFAEQKELAEHVQLSPATVSQYLAVAELPDAVVEAFGDPRTISMRWMQALSAALKASRAGVLANAARIAKQSPRPEPEAVLKELIAVGRTAKRRGGPEAETVKMGGKSLYTISWKGSRVSLKFGKQVEGELVGEAQEALKQFLSDWLKKRVKT
jgi:ParB family chromosome partitioning protein